MPSRSKITQLPPEVRRELERLMTVRGFADYTALAEWLGGQGFEISRSSVHRHGQVIEERIARLKAATDIAVIIADEVGDDAGKVTDAVVRMYQEKIFSVLLAMQELDPADVDITKLGRVIAEITRSSISQKKWMEERVKDKAKDAAEEVVRAVKKSGLSEATAEEIRKKILGIV